MDWGLEKDSAGTRRSGPDSLSAGNVPVTAVILPDGEREETSLTPATLRAVEATLSPARLSRYLAAADGNLELALRLYIWNAR